MGDVEAPGALFPHWTVSSITAINYDYRHRTQQSPMLLTYLHLVHINTILEPPLTLFQHNVIRRVLTLAHPPIFREGPILKAIGPLPFHPVCGVLVFIPELNGNLVVCKGKQFFPQTVIVFLLPFLCEKVNNGIVPLKKEVSVTPNAVRCVCFGYGGRVSTASQISLDNDLRVFGLPGVPKVLCLFHLLVSSLFCERWCGHSCGY
jgi:hypothetical protein